MSGVCSPPREIKDQSTHTPRSVCVRNALSCVGFRGLRSDLAANRKDLGRISNGGKRTSRGFGPRLAQPPYAMSGTDAV
eukprot:705580-Rhodomonas_salina.2